MVPTMLKYINNQLLAGYFFLMRINNNEIFIYENLMLKLGN